eukprot:CAMPEP_0184485224 /NCGR_PEP_ID=MMETSP0113_2-20130426/6866_1 /TAXON_ID=91329 /ORGANISM="Norrisiella sphaerica, Strain BC52" /LENGTH=270 /DNA_ID=CAMNT_0026866587 /DNA_START=178 /DNA_END=990 /DNA_ORIENTATION=+
MKRGMNFIEHFQAGGYESGADVGKRQRLAFSAPSSSSSHHRTGGGRPSSKAFQDAQKTALRGLSHNEFSRMNCYERHHKLMEDYIRYYGGNIEDLKKKPPEDTMSDFDLLKEAYRFLPEPEDFDDSTYEKRMAKKYYDKLFKEYCVGYLQKYKEGKIGMRWRTEAEVVRGKGQFICGSNSCDSTKDLKSYEVNFAYEEQGEQRQALVKLRVCPECAYKLNYKKIKKLEKKKNKDKPRRAEKELKKRLKKLKKKMAKKEKRKRATRTAVDD